MDSFEAPRKLRILMLHGFGQSGHLFKFNTRQLTTELQNILSPALRSAHPGGLEFLYPTAPVHLLPADYPESPKIESETADRNAWWRNLDVVSEYQELPATMLFLYNYIQQHGPVDGVVGFSQGGAMALMFASWCEARTRLERQAALAKQHIPITMAPPQGPLKFVVCVSGFRRSMSHYEGFFNPQIQTPSLHITATLDIMVSDVSSLRS